MRPPRRRHKRCAYPGRRRFRRAHPPCRIGRIAGSRGARSAKSDRRSWRPFERWPLRPSPRKPIRNLPNRSRDCLAGDDEQGSYKPMMSLWFQSFLLPRGWAERVRIDIAQGRIHAVIVNVAPDPASECHAIGMPGLPNLHSHAFQRGMAGLDGSSPLDRRQFLDLARYHVPLCRRHRPRRHRGDRRFRLHGDAGSGLRSSR